MLMSCTPKVLKPESANYKDTGTPPTSDPVLTNIGGLPVEKLPLYGPMVVKRLVLKNGLRILIVEDHASPTFAYNIFFRVGSRDEEPLHTGLAHLFEHMMFKETKNLKEGEFDKILEAEGAEGENAYTTRDYTAYVEEMPSSKLELVTRLESERMVNLVIDEKAFKTETEVVQNERRYRVENSPDGMMYQELFSTAFEKHPYHWPVIGYQQDLDRMTAEDALRFYKNYYSPQHATLVVVGDVDPEQVVALAQKYYGPLAMEKPLDKKFEEEPPQLSPRRKILKFDIKVEKLMLAYHMPRVTDPNYPAIEFIQFLLSSGKSSRLYRALVETGIAASADAGAYDGKDPSLFVISATLQENKKAAQAEAIIMKELSRITEQPIPPAELKKVKNLADFLFFQDLDSNSEIARFLGHYEAVAGDFSKGLQIHHQKKNVTGEQIMSIAKTLFQPNNRTVIFGTPK